MESKEEIYKSVLERVETLVEGEVDLISVMSTIACEIFNTFDYINWAGFYRMVNETTLKVGPYQGSHGCLEIDIERGVCGKCVREASVQLENDVSKLPFHIACSSETKAEIVLPVLDSTGEVRAVLDIDSVVRGAFDNIDEKYLSKICMLVSGCYIIK